MTREELIEVMARALYDATPFKETAGGYDQQSDTYKRMCVLLASAALSALEAAGVRMVPVVSTYKMDAAAAFAVDGIVDDFSMKDAPLIWEAMLAASPYAQKDTKE